MAARYQEANPQIDVRLRLSEHALDLIADSIDIELRLAAFEDSSTIMRKVAQVDRVLCAAPAYLARAGTPEKPATSCAINACSCGSPDCVNFAGPSPTKARILPFPSPAIWRPTTPMCSPSGRWRDGASS